MVQGPRPHRGAKAVSIAAGYLAVAVVLFAICLPGYKARRLTGFSLVFGALLWPITLGLIIWREEME